jgi:cell division protein FtsN
MSTITAPGSSSTSSPSTVSQRSQRSRRAVALIVSAIVVVAAAIALTVWLFAQSPTHHSKVTSPPLTNIQKLGVPGQGGNPSIGGSNNQCAPAPGERFC